MTDIDTSAVPVELGNRITIKVHAGAAKIVRRKHSSDPPICVGIPPIVWNGRSYSRYEVAEGTGISPSMVSKIFNASRKPSLGTAIRLATFFRVSVDTLLAQILPRIEIKRI